MDPVWLLASGAAGLAAGALVPPLVRGLPEPDPEPAPEPAPAPEPDPEADGAGQTGERGAEPATKEPAGEPATEQPAKEQPAKEQPAKEQYVDLAARPGLAARCAGAGLVAGLLLGWQLPAPWPLLLWLALLPVGLALAVVDWRTRLLPRLLVLPATGLALATVAGVELTVGDPADLVRAGLAALVVRSTFWVLWWFRSAGFGFGDVRLGALLGLLLGQLGWAEVLVGVYAAFLAFALPGLVLAVVRRDRSVLRTAYPFGPYLLAGAVAGAAWGAPLWAGLAGG